MKNLALTYLPAYVGLYASLTFAIACNAYLDIHHGTFASEVLIWAVIYALTLWIGWRQQGAPSAWGKTWQTWLFVVAVLASILLFLPGWGLPRGGLYMLAALQASFNCITTTRRHLQLGLVVAAAMAMFAASHSRADWTMLFYLIPFVIAAVFTLIAEQISRRTNDIHGYSLDQNMVAGQGAAITAAVLAILVLAGSLFVIIPSTYNHFIFWRYGVVTNIGVGNGDNSSDSDAGHAGSGAVGIRLTPEEMRDAARLPGMPIWQVGAIHALVDITESIKALLEPVRNKIADLWNTLLDWLENNVRTLALMFIALLLIILFRALWLLLREEKMGLWLATRLDFVRIVVLGQHRHGRHSAVQLYEAMVRLFALQEQPRVMSMNVREYLTLLSRTRSDQKIMLVEMTILFEDARYSSMPPGEHELGRMRSLYEHIYRNVSE